MNHDEWDDNLQRGVMIQREKKMQSDHSRARRGDPHMSDTLEKRKVQPHH